MVSRIKLLALILAIPVVGFAVSKGLQARFNSQVRTAIHEQMPDADSKAIANISMDELCENAPPEMGEVCSTYRNLNLINVGSLAAAAAGLILVFVIWLAGFMAQSNRLLLLHIFRPGLYLTVLVLAALIIVHAAIAIATIFYTEAIFVGRIHARLMGVIGLGAVIGVISMVSKAFSIVRDIQTQVIGKKISREEAPALWERVEEIGKGIGALAPEHVVVGLDPNFFVTEADVICLDGELKGRTLFCSLPLCRILSEQELSSIIGHELGHYKGMDTIFSQKFFPIYRGTAMSIATLEETGAGGIRATALLPAIAILSYFLECFSVAEARISRDRELQADQEGASISSKMSAASALVKVHAFADLWGGFQHAMVEALRDGKAFVNVSEAYAQAVSKNATPEALDGISEAHTSHPTDSHPLLSERMAALGISIDQVSESALDVSPASSAASLLKEIHKVEEDITEIYQSIMAHQLGIVPQSEEQGPESGDAE